MSRAAFSPILVKKPDVMKITQAEYHTTTPEMIFPLNDDMIIHVAPASAGTPVPELTKAFIVPKGTLVKINSAIWHLAPLPVHADELQAMIILPECTYANDAIWHLAPLPVHADELQAMIILPECTYANDCTVVDYAEEDQFIIEL